MSSDYERLVPNYEGYLARVIAPTRNPLRRRPKTKRAATKPACEGLDSYREGFRIEEPFGNFDDRSGHAYRKIRGDFDADQPAGHVHRYVTVDQAETVATAEAALELLPEARV